MYEVWQRDLYACTYTQLKTLVPNSQKIAFQVLLTVSKKKQKQKNKHAPLENNYHMPRFHGGNLRLVSSHHRAASSFPLFFPFEQKISYDVKEKTGQKHNRREKKEGRVKKKHHKHIVIRSHDPTTH